MDIATLDDEWENLAMETKRNKWQSIMNYTIKNFDRFEGPIWTEIIPIFRELESMDYFGTEGTDL